MIVIPNVTVVKPENCLECCACRAMAGGGHGEGHYYEYKCNLLGRILSSYGVFKEKPPSDCPFAANNFSLICDVPK